MSSGQNGGQPPPTTFVEFLRKMQSPDPDAPLDPPMGELCIDDEFKFLAMQIDECTGYFLRLQKTMTTALERYEGCLLVGMQIHMLGRVVRAAEHIGLSVPQLEFIHHHIPDLWLMETIMWEALEEIEPHLEYLLHPNIDMMVNHVNISIN